MRHVNTKTLYAYWDARRLGRSAPSRGDIAPRDLAGLLSHLFILRRMDRDHHIFRLAGTSLCQMHQREFKDQNFLGLWRGHDRHHMTALLEGAMSVPAPACALADAVSLEGRSVEVEIALLPLRGPEGWVDRCLGLYQPLQTGGLAGRPAVRHVLKELHPAMEPEASINVFGRTYPQAIPARAANDF